MEISAFMNANSNESIVKEKVVYELGENKENSQLLKEELKNKENELKNEQE